MSSGAPSILLIHSSPIFTKSADLYYSTILVEVEFEFKVMKNLFIIMYNGENCLILFTIQFFYMYLNMNFTQLHIFIMYQVQQESND